MSIRILMPVRSAKDSTPGVPRLLLIKNRVSKNLALNKAAVSFLSAPEIECAIDELTRELRIKAKPGGYFKVSGGKGMVAHLHRTLEAEGCAFSEPISGCIDGSSLVFPLPKRQLGEVPKPISPRLKTGDRVLAIQGYRSGDGQCIAKGQMGVLRAPGKEKHLVHWDSGLSLSVPTSSLELV